MMKKDITRRDFIKKATVTTFGTAGLMTLSSGGAVAKDRAQKEKLMEEPVVSNDSTQLVPQTSFDGSTLEFDFPALRIGVAEYTEGPTGCTVFYFPEGATSVADIGSNPATIMGTSNVDGVVDAICFAGGTHYGLEAATGVAAALFAMRDYSAERAARVRGATIWDFWRDNTIYPDKALGRAALKSLQTGIFPLGPRGVGCSTGCGGGFGDVKPEPTGQGGAFRQVGSTKIAVFTVVNALGAIVNRQGQVVRGNFDRRTGRRIHTIEALERKLVKNEKIEASDGNTTLTLVITSQKLDLKALRQLARQVHSSMGRAIQPFHTMNDGDILFAVTTGEVESNTLYHFNLEMSLFCHSEVRRRISCSEILYSSPGSTPAQDDNGLKFNREWY